MMSNHEVFENAVASIVDVTSVMIAYTIGISQSSFLLGLAYAVFDAIIVVWMRKPISRLIRSVLTIRGDRSSIRDAYFADSSEF